MAKNDYQRILHDIDLAIDDLRGKGQIATYIPELANVDPDKFGVHLSCMHSGHYSRWSPLE